MSELFTKYRANPRALRDSIDDLRQQVPPPLTDLVNKVDKAEAVADYESRFSDMTMS